MNAPVRPAKILPGKTHGQQPEDPDFEDRVRSSFARPDATDRAWAILFARAILGLIFFMAGGWKVFELGPLQHARRFFVEPYAQSFLPRWSLWTTGVTVPFVELVAGALLLVGWRVRPALLGLGSVLVIVTFGHLLAEPLYEFHTHVIPRSSLLLFLLVMPRSEDRFSIDQWLMRRRAGA
jgi:putative oxidoreductase